MADGVDVGKDISNSTPAEGQPLPPRPDEMRWSGGDLRHRQPLGAASAGGGRNPSLLFKLLGALMVVAGLLFLKGVLDAYAKHDDSPVGPMAVVAVLALATAFGGRHLYRKGWQKGRDLANVMAVLPAGALVVLFTIIVLNPAPAPSPSPTGATLEAISDATSEVAEFNAISTSIWSSWADRRVTAREWINLADEQLPRLRTSVEAIEASVASIADAGVRAKAQTYTDTLRDEMDLIGDLRDAVASGDRDAVRAILDAAPQIYEERARAAQELTNATGIGSDSGVLTP